MAQSLIPAPSKMEIKGDLVSNWQYFKSSWLNYEIATELNTKEDNVRVATLMTVMGRDCYQVFENLPLTEEESTKTDTILKKLGEHFEPQRNIVYERYVFNTDEAKQEASESIEQYFNRLRKLVSTCDYGVQTDDHIRDRIVSGIRDSATKSRLLRERKLTLDKALDICRSSESTALHLQKMERTDEAVHQLKTKTKSHGSQHQKRNCKYCGDNHPRGKCPAYGQECSNCQKRNHFAKVCKAAAAANQHSKGFSGRYHKAAKQKQKVHLVSTDQQEAELSSSDSIYNVHTSPHGTQYHVQLQTKTRSGKQSANIRYQIDTGATCSTLRIQDYKSLTSEPLCPSTARLRLYDKSVISPIGATTLQCIAGNGVKKLVHFEVLENAPTSLLSGRASEALGLVQFSQEHLVHTVKTTPQLTIEDIMRDYKDVFNGLGRLPGIYHIEMDKSEKPVQNTRHRVPVPVREELRQSSMR